ncbi:hypothetical protein HED22_14625 [Thalassospira sp. HF15]|uniref:hypothetical protein n=1 Tax=Thalassospira sp. HF15 TaxID=2722755 RepID=UPI0014314707|nr:hypothetical protein [Thalassospira sp. HF15]NIY76885.1 hypothetical protein [Thalassospira sp. HF15]
MNEQLLYWLIVGAGAFTLLVEAYRSFNSPNGRHPFELHPILQQVEARTLCTNGEIIAGFLCYATMYLVLYAAILGSAEVYTLVSLAAGAQTTVGAIPTPEEHDFYGKPIFVSALLISFLSLGPVKPIERTMRSFAHRLAGIPRGVYRVIETLHAFPFEKHCSQMATPLCSKFEKKLTALKDQQNAFLHIAEIKSSLLAIDCLAMATRTDSRTLYFPMHRMSQLTELLKTLEEEHHELSKAIDALPEHTSNSQSAMTDDEQQAYVDFARKAAITRENTMALFSVMFVRNNRSIFSVQQVIRDRESSRDNSNPIEVIKEFIQGTYNAEQNAFALAFLVAICLGFLSIVSTYFVWAKIIDVFSNQQIYPSVELALEAATWDSIRSAAVIFSSVLFVIYAREVRVEQQSWNTNWKLHHFPFLRILSLSLFSGVAAIFSSAFIDIANLAFDVDFQLTTTQITFHFQQFSTFYFLQFGAGVILAFAALVIMDKHDHLHSKWTITIAVLFMALYCVYMFGVNFVAYDEAWTHKSARDAIIFCIVPFIFLTMFAGLLELSEGPETPKPNPAGG